MNVSVLMQIALAGVLLCALPLAEAFTLDIFGNANMDDAVDEMDIDYLKGVIAGTNPVTNLSDANYDGTIDDHDIEQVEKIISGDETEITLIDSADRIVTVPMPLERIVVYSSYAIEGLRAIGVDLDEKIVGVYNYIQQNGEYYPQVKDKPTVGSYKEIDYEKIAELKPQVVLFYTASQPFVSEDKITISGAKVVYLDVYMPDALESDLGVVGFLFGKEKEMKKVIDWHQQISSKIEDKIKYLSQDEKPRAFLYNYPDSYLPEGVFATKNKNSSFHQVFVKAGLINIAADLPEDSPHVEPEWILEQDPDVIIGKVGAKKELSGYLAEDSRNLTELREKIRNAPGINGTKAARENKIFLICTDIDSGIDDIVGISYVAKCLHPDLFGDLDPIELHREYIEDLQGLEYKGIWFDPLPSTS